MSRGGRTEANQTARQSESTYKSRTSNNLDLSRVIDVHCCPKVTQETQSSDA